MSRALFKTLVVGVVMLMVAGCSGASGAATDAVLRLAASPPIPATEREFVNPLRGQYEDLMIPLFPQGNPAQRGFPAWPGTFDVGIRVSWRELQPTDPAGLPAGAPDDRRYDFGVIDRAMAQAEARGMRLMLRVYAYNSCCDATYPDNTNTAIPDWLRAVPGASTMFNDGGVAQVVPNWNSPDYLAGFEQLLAALGRRYDGDERLSVFEFSGYGDFSENHIAYLRDSLNAPGPAPDESVAKLGYYSQFQDQSIDRESITRLVAANVSAFPRTQLVTTPQNPEIVRQLLADEVTARLSAPVGIRSDCLGVIEPLPAWAHDAGSRYVQNDDDLVEEIDGRIATAPMITEWCQPPDGADRRAYYQKGLDDVVAFHVSMTSSVNFPDREADQPMAPELFSLWSRANLFAGYRYSVEAVAGSGTVSGGVAAMDVRWSNSGAAIATERWVPSYRVTDRSGAVVRTIPASVDLKKLLGDRGDGSAQAPAPAAVVEPLQIATAGLAPGEYTVSAGVTWAQHKPNPSHVVNYPPMALARDGRSADGWYPVADLRIP